MLQPGTVAPDFKLLSANGDLFELAETLKKANVVLYFYPKDETSGCIKEACSFRDQYEVFKEFGAEVVGVSSDDSASHQKFAQRLALPFTLLSDEKGTVRKLYKVPRTMGLIPGRTTYVIDQKGIIRYAFNSLFKPLEHVAGALEVLKNLTNAQ